MSYVFLSYRQQDRSLARYLWHFIRYAAEEYDEKPQSSSTSVSRIPAQVVAPPPHNPEPPQSTDPEPPRKSSFNWLTLGVASVVALVVIGVLLSNLNPADPTTLTQTAIAQAQFNQTATSVALTQTALALPPTATPTLTPTNTPPTIARRTPTNTPPPTIARRTPTNTPPPTIAREVPSPTPYPTSELFGDEVLVTFRDDFDAEQLSSRWASWTQKRGKLENGRLVIVGSENWNDAITRSGIDTNEGILLKFQVHNTPNVNFMLSVGEWSSELYRRLAIQTNPDDWLEGEEGAVVSYQDVRGSVSQTYARTSIESRIWLYLLMRVGADGKFYIQIWRQFYYDRFFVNLELEPRGEWANRLWDFVMQMHSGTLYVEYYEELRFPADYEMLDKPPR